MRERKPHAVSVYQPAASKEGKLSTLLPEKKSGTASSVSNSELVMETRQSFATQASTFVGTDRLSTFQNFFDLPSERMKLSLFNINEQSTNGINEEDDDNENLLSQSQATSIVNNDSKVFIQVG